MQTEKQDWISRYVATYVGLGRGVRFGQIYQVAETYWFYLRHRTPEAVARERVDGPVLAARPDAWAQACSHALQELQPALGRDEALSLARQLWLEDQHHAVDPQVMASALYEQFLKLQEHTVTQKR